MRIASWNVNSVRQRLGHIERLCKDASPDVLCLQETKVDDPEFPAASLADLGYEHRILNGQKSYNGVAILSRVPFVETGHRNWCRKRDCRHAYARFDSGIELHNFYVPSGGDIPDPEQNEKFDHKVKFLRAMARWCREDQVRARKVILVGDLNVAPLEHDVWNHKRLVKSVGHTPQESDLMARLLRSARFVDVARHFVPPPTPLYTWWGYRFKESFERNYGWRLDHAWVTEPLLDAVRGLTVFRDARTWERPSDHVPVILDLH